LKIRRNRATVSSNEGLSGWEEDRAEDFGSPFSAALVLLTAVTPVAMVLIYLSPDPVTPIRQHFAFKEVTHGLL
jgi:hypothetical protein